MLASDVIDAARVNLQDPVATYRWSDAIMIDFLNRGIRDVRKRRPDSILDSDAELVSWTAVTATSDTLIVDDVFLSFLIYYTTARALEIDSDDTENLARAQRFDQLAEQELI